MATMIGAENPDPTVAKEIQLVTFPNVPQAVARPGETSSYILSRNSEFESSLKYQLK